MASSEIPLTSKTPSQGDGESDEESLTLSTHSDDLAEQLDYLDFGEDTYSATFVSIIKDTHQFALNTKLPCLHGARLLTMVLLILFNIAIQCTLMHYIYTKVVGKYVHDIRDAYDSYERVMYGPNESHFWYTVNGKARGIGGHDGPYFQLSNFANLSDSDKFNVCSIPFTRPLFFQSVLLIWSLIVLYELNTILNLFQRLVWRMRRASPRHGMKRCFKKIEQSFNDHVIRELTLPVKVVITLLLVIRLAITLCLMWFGCRWLCATNNYEYLLLNSVALGFLLEMPSLLYKSIVPNRVRRDVENTKIDIQAEGEAPSSLNFLVPIIVRLIFTIGWVALYFYKIQAVLPFYQFDVALACKDYDAERYNQ